MAELAVGKIYEFCLAYRPPNTAETIREIMSRDIAELAREAGVTIGEIEFEDGTVMAGKMLGYPRVIARTKIVAIKGNG